MAADKIVGGLKSLAKRGVNQVLRSAGMQVTRLEADQIRQRAVRLDLGEGDVEGTDVDARRVLNLLNYTKTSGSAYSGDEFEPGYHSITIGQMRYVGQRDPAQRLASVPFDFAGKTVLDIGCNQGGMLFELPRSIKHGVGIDYDSRMINVANRIRSQKKLDNVDFYVFDLEREDLAYINDFLSTPRVDIAFLLSICMWIRNWREVVGFVSQLSDNLLFESNGSPQQRQDQEDQLSTCFADVQLLKQSSEDDPKQQNRKLYLCSGPR